MRDQENQTSNNSDSKASWADVRSRPKIRAANTLANAIIAPENSSTDHRSISGIALKLELVKIPPARLRWAARSMKRDRLTKKTTRVTSASHLIWGNTTATVGPIPASLCARTVTKRMPNAARQL
jgi:hypothetical protein